MVAAHNIVTNKMQIVARLLTVILRIYRLLILHKLLFMYQRRLIVAEGDLISHAARVVEDRFNRGFYDLAARHGDADAVADFELTWGWVGFLWHDEIVRSMVPTPFDESDHQIYRS